MKSKIHLKNSFVKNTDAKKKLGDSKTKDKTTISKKAYSGMENKWVK